MAYPVEHSDPLSNRELIDLRQVISHPVIRLLHRLIGGPLERFFQIPETNACYRKLKQQDASFFEAALQALELDYRTEGCGPQEFPGSGPLIVVANHPFGGVDGIVLGHLLHRVRADFKILVNFLLHGMPEIEPYSIPVDPFGGSQASRKNASGIRAALRHIEGGGCLGSFPAGEVSHFSLRKRRIVETHWHAITARLIRKTGASVVPVHFSGRNSALFHMAGLIHPLLRTALIPRETMRKRATTLRLTVGKTIPPKRLQGIEDDGKLMEFLRLRTQLLALRPCPNHLDPAERSERAKEINTKGKSRAFKPMIDAVPISTVLGELDQLPQGSLLLEKGPFQVWHAHGHQIPGILRELGRLREATFREVREGTGEPIDVDRFDLDYIHLFIWNDGSKEIVGAYRMGATDEILPRKRRKGFYTNTLFRYRTAFLENLDPALELGRSFIRSSYQKKYSSLAMLWHGIGAFIARHPRYRYLFGPVSISCDYTTASRDLIVHFLMGKNFDPKLSAKVRGRTPPRKRSTFTRAERETLATSFHDIDEISALVSEMEHDQKGIPTLLRHYVKLNARFLSFNVDASFNDVLDGLMIVDLLQTDPKILKFFMGPKAAEAFYEAHGVSGAPDGALNLKRSAEPDSHRLTLINKSLGKSTSSPNRWSPLF